MTKKRNGIQVMAGLIGMVLPLMGFMLLAILMGCVGNLAATFITVLGGLGLVNVLGLSSGLTLKAIFILLAVLAVARGVLRYSEQACNHYIAFRLLARIRHRVFAALRKLAPAKLDGRDKGNLISLITTDIELLEVFYAHTISPIAIAVITSVIMTVFIGSQIPLAGAVAAAAYFLVGAVIPVLNGRAGREDGKSYRQQFGGLNTVVLDNLYGLDEILQYGCGSERLEKMADMTEKLEDTNRSLKQKESRQKIMTDTVILAAGAAAVLLGMSAVGRGTAEFPQAVAAVIALMSSFGPTAALSSLSNNLNQTLAAGDRVLDLLEETPLVTEISEGDLMPGGSVKAEDLTFSYQENEENVRILEHFSKEFGSGINGIHGKSGCGKSTLLKLLMRFYEPEAGRITYGGTDVNNIRTDSLRSGISYVTQETWLFHDTIENNIKAAKADATREEVIAAAKKASVHEFIESLPEGYDTKVAEAGDSLSGGERQRIGIARAFLHDSRIIYLDEPTSNIDSLNEGIVLKSLYEEKEDRIILLVSHRDSTMGICDTVLEMQ